VSEPSAPGEPEGADRPDGTDGADGAVGTGPVPLRRNGGFQRLWIGQLLSDTGSEIGLIAYPLLILALTGSPVLAGAVGTARELAVIGLRLPAGALADRFDRRRTMIACDTVRAALMAVLGILVAVNAASWPLILVFSLVEGGLAGLFDPAAAAALPAIVAEEQLAEAWAATEGRTWGAALAGPALGGLLFGLGRAVPFLADAVSYAASFGTVSAIRGRFRPERAPQRRPLWHEMLDGLRIVWQVPLLRAVAVQGPLVNFAFNGVLFTITVGLRQHGTPAAVIGVVQAGVMAGGVLGAPLAPPLQRRLRPRAMSLTSILAGTALFAVAAVVIPSPLVALPVAVVVLLAPAGNSVLFAVMLRQVPEEMRGRVTSTVTTAAMSLATLAPLLAGLLVEHVSVSWAMGAFAAAEAVAAVLALVMRGLRDADRAAAAPGLGLQVLAPPQPDQGKPAPDRREVGGEQALDEHGGGGVGLADAGRGQAEDHARFHHAHAAG
jgi:MFS family permease